MPELYILIPACFALNLSFGPSNLLALTHGARVGPLFALKAAVGRFAMFVPMMAICAAGLGLILATSALAFTAVKVIGATYLLWIGIKILKSMRAGAGAAPGAGPAPTLREAFRREAVVCMGNPKTIVIFSAFFPQFIDPSDYWRSWVIMGALFIALEAVVVVLYASLGRFAARAAGARMHWIQGGSGAGMILFAVVLLLASRPATA